MIYKTKDSPVYKAGDKYVRTTRHEYESYLNTYKIDYISEFIDEYRKVARLIINELWCKNYIWEFKGRKYSMWLKRGIYMDVPKFLRTGFFNCLKHYRGKLTGRALSSLCNQIISIIKGIVKSAKATKEKIVKPNLDRINPEISSKHVDFQFNEKSTSIFDLHISLKCLFSGYKSFIVPIKIHKMDNKHSQNGVLMASISLTKRSVNIRYEFKSEKVEKEEHILGIDVGINKICSMSNRLTTPTKNIANKSIQEIFADMNRKKKGSNAYKRKIKERDYFINEVINNTFNSFDIQEYSLVHLESNKEIKLNTSNANSHWSLMVLNDKILRICQDNQVDLSHVPSMYKSQRCFKCSFVHRNNRHEEKFKCLNCHHTDDADINASLNDSLKLTYDDLWLFKDCNRSSGFFWYMTGCCLPLQADMVRSVP